MPQGSPQLPNFFVAGANTAGTTSLHHYLRQHPQVYMSPIKEPTFFAAADMLSRDAFVRTIERDRSALRSYLEGPQDRPARYWVPEWGDYVQLFKNVSGQRAIGEASASYFWLPSAAPAIRSRLPGARFIFVLRHPAERLFSWYLKNIERDPRLRFRTWFLEAKDAGGDGGPTPDRYTLPLDGGRCAPHLRRFYDLFPRNQIRVYLFDSFRTDVSSVLRDMFLFLDVDPDQPIDVSQRLNETAATPRFPIVHAVRRRLLGDRSLASRLPAGLQRAVRGLYRRRRGSLTMDADDRRMVIAYYRDDIVRTGDLIARDLSAWLD